MTSLTSGPQTPPLLRIVDASVRKGRRGGRAILDRLNLEISLGENSAILGPNGSGKSSLIRLITREYYPLASPDGSTVQIFGRGRWDVFELRMQLGIVTPDLDNEFTDRRVAGLRGMDTVLSGFFATRGVQSFQEVTTAMRDRAGAVLELMDALHLANKPMGEMSTGEVRRIVIARALVPDPPALLLDEPTAGLDIVAMQTFLETIRRLARAGKTIVMVTHHPHEIIPEIRRIVLLKDGRVCRDGEKEDVLTAANLSDVFNAPLHVHTDEQGYYRVTLQRSPG